MKTKVKIEENGLATPQYRRWFIWRDFYYEYGDSYLLGFNPIKRQYWNKRDAEYFLERIKR